MPPRFAYWTILIDGKPTAFRARDQQELQPTITQLKRTNQDVVMKWFARGKVWESPEAEREAHRRPAFTGEKRGADWRPGGAHKDPRDRFKKKHRPERAWSPGDRPMRRDRDAPGPPRDSKPWRDKPSAAPRGDRPWSAKPAPRKPWSPKPSDERRPWGSKPQGPSKSWGSKRQGPPKPWRPKPPGDHKPWRPKPPAEGKPWQGKPFKPSGPRPPWRDRPDYRKRRDDDPDKK